MRSLTVLLVAILPLLLCGPAALAGDPPVPIEGILLVSGSEDVSCGWATDPFAYFMIESSDGILPAPGFFGDGDISPTEQEVAYTAGIGDWPDYLLDICKADIDGSDPVNLTAVEGLGGINCLAEWSPDGSQIAFQHCDPVPGLLPCEAGFYTWVMDADGTDAYRLETPGGEPCRGNPIWSPNGYRILCRLDSMGTVTIDIDGTDAESVPNIGSYPSWSPDGSQIASTVYQWDTVDAEPGHWRQLRLTKADGSDPQTLVEQFVKDSEALQHVTDLGCDLGFYDWVEDCRFWVGPTMSQFSPRGDRIAFLAALPFDPGGLYYKKQIQVWMYDLETADLTQLTNDTWSYNNMSWNGHNTFPHDPEVTVDNTTVTFDEVTEEGLTTIIRDDDPPELPVGYEVCGEFYEITTTAEIEGPITVCMTYEDEDVPPGTAEEDLTILHYVADGDYWEDITVSVDTENNVICGETESLSVFTLSGLRPASFPDVPSTGLGLGGADGHWAFDAVEACVAAGVVSGYPDGLYRPDRPVTRDQMAVYISRSLTGEAGIPAGPETPTFPDVPADHWAYDSIEYVVSSDVVTGYPNGYYRPDYNVSRDQMAVFVARAQGWVSIDDDMTTAPDLFPDVPAGHWAGTPIEACVDNGVVNGYPDGLYRPNADVTRDQMAVYIARAFDLMP